MKVRSNRMSRKTLCERKVSYSFGQKELRDVAASCSRRISARFVQHGPQVEGGSGPRPTPQLMIDDLRRKEET